MDYGEEIHCCEGCGRDCRGGFCSHCMGRRPKIVETSAPFDPLEDDYGDESDADSVCDDFQYCYSILRIRRRDRR